MDKLLARLSEQQAMLNHQNEALKSGDGDVNICQRVTGHTSSSNSLPITPATDGFSSTAPSTRPASAALDEARSDSDEVLRLKLQLAQAQNKICKLDQELAHRTMKAEPDLQVINTVRGMGASARENAWVMTDDDHSDTSDALSTTLFARARGIWGTTKGPFAGNVLQGAAADPQPGTWLGGRGFNEAFTDASSTYHSMDGYREDRLSPDPDLVMRQSASRRSHRYDHRVSNSHHFTNMGYNPVNGPMAPFEAVGGQMASGNMHQPSNLPMGMGAYASYQQQPVGTPLSPHASEFTSKTHWKTEVSPIVLTLLRSCSMLTLKVGSSN
jgi:hypothetical protein